MVKYRLFLLCVLLCLTAGCVTPTADNPFGIKDPNQVQGWIDVGVQIGQGAAAAGTATGNPYLLAWGAGLVSVGGLLTAILFGKRKKDGESES
jgi:hypothetical protein